MHRLVLYKVTISQACMTVTLVSLGGWLPIFWANDRQAHLSLLVYIRVINLGFEGNFRWLERILSWKCNFYLKCTFIVWLGHLKNIHEQTDDLTMLQENDKRTGTISPCQYKMLVSSTIISLNTLRLASLMSLSSYKRTDDPSVCTHSSTRYLCQSPSGSHCLNSTSIF